MAEEAATQIGEITAMGGVEGRPTGSKECWDVLQYLASVVAKFASECVTVVWLENGAGLVVRVGREEETEEKVVLLYTHVDFHPQKQQRTEGETQLFDNSGGVAMLLSIVVELCDAYKKSTESAKLRWPLHAAFLTGGDVYAAEDTEADSRRVHGFGVREYVAWCNRQSVSHHCAMNVYASLYEMAQTCLELEEAGRNDRFLYLHVLGAGYALGELNVTRDATKKKVLVQLPREDRPKFDTAFLRAYNKVASEAIVQTQGGGGVYLVPGCHPPWSDASTTQLADGMSVPVLQVDAPLCMCKDTAGSMKHSAFAHVKSVIFEAVYEFVCVRNEQYFGGTRHIVVQCGDVADECEDSCKGGLNGAPQSVGDETQERSCVVQ